MDQGGPQWVIINTSRAVLGNKEKTLCRVYRLDFLLIYLFMVCVPRNAKYTHQYQEAVFRSSSFIPDSSGVLHGVLNFLYTDEMQASHDKDTLVVSLQPLCFAPASRCMFEWTFCMSKCLGTNFPFHFLLLRITQLEFNRKALLRVGSAVRCPPGRKAEASLLNIVAPSRGRVALNQTGGGCLAAVTISFHTLGSRSCG